MRFGSADVYSNHPIVIVGSSGDVDDHVQLDGAAAANSDAHVLVATRGQAALVRVTLWSGRGPRLGHVVFDGVLTLADHTIAAFDVEGLSRFTATLGATGPQRVTVLVDDPGNASRIDVVVGSGNENHTLRAVPDFPLFTVSVPAATELGPSDELALILSGHDWPMRRLAAAIKVIGESPVPRLAIRSFWMGMLVEWLRWLAPDLTLDDSHTLGSMIEERLLGASDDSMDAVAVELASEIVRRST